MFLHVCVGSSGRCWLLVVMMESPSIITHSAQLAAARASSRRETVARQ